MAGRIAPGGVGDDVAVFAQQRLDHLQQPGVGYGALGRGAAVEHGVAEHRHVLRFVIPAHVGRVAVVDGADLPAQLPPPPPV